MARAHIEYSLEEHENLLSLSVDENGWRGLVVWDDVDRFLDALASGNE